MRQTENIGILVMATATAAETIVIEKIVLVTVVTARKAAEIAVATVVSVIAAAHGTTARKTDAIDTRMTSATRKEVSAIAAAHGTTARKTDAIDTKMTSATRKEVATGIDHVVLITLGIDPTELS